MVIRSHDDTQNVRSIVEGLHRFIKRTTGLTVDSKIDKYIVNPDYVLNNNLHFLQQTRQEGLPNADATTEGQSLMIIGYLYCYLGTGDAEYLEHAKAYWDAYVTWWYKQQPIPTSPQRWVCNWIINGKEPILANYPLDPLNPTHGGFKGVELTWTDGFTIIPHGAPTYGEYTDVVTFAFDGVLTYDAINAAVRATLPDGSTDWDSDGVKYDVDWVILWTGDKVTTDGEVLSTGHLPEEVGSVQLKDTTVQGLHKFNYATRNPVEHGGYLIARNEPIHNRPIHTPTGELVNNMGNAADGEVWFLDACYLMWKVTGEAKYKQALDSVHFTANEYTYLDSISKFFRQDVTSNTPFTEGISYTYQYPDVPVIFSRDDEGYIQIEVTEPAKVTLVQSAVTFRIDNDAKVRTVYGGEGTNGLPVNAAVVVNIAQSKTGEGIPYVAVMSPKLTSDVEEVIIPVTEFVRLATDTGEDYLLASEGATSDYGDITVTTEYVPSIEGPTLPDSSRAGNVVNANFPTDSGGLIIGFWLAEGERADITSIVYRSDGETWLSITDDNLWKWHWVLPDTGNEWTHITLNRNALTLNGYQGDHPDATEFPTEPVYTDLDKVTISPEEPLNFSYYCVNTMPPVFSSTDSYIVEYKVTLSNDSAFTGYLGHCDVIDARDDLLSYTPGVIPFSNANEPGSSQLSAWKGIPYPGYQAPSMYCLGLGEGQALRLANSIEFMYDAQQWYNDRYGILGPVASAYVWDRWDAVQYGDPNTFTEYHWGSSKAWDGYQPRAFSWMCRTWQQLVDNGEIVPQKLIDYCNNWISFLWDFTEREDNPDHWLPYTYPEDSAPVPIANDFNAAMGGLYLSGCCLAAMAGCELTFIDALIDRINVDFENAYYIDKDAPDDLMTGSYTSSASEHIFYGFHGGEALKGLGAYLMYKKHTPGQISNYKGN